MLVSLFSSNHTGVLFLHQYGPLYHERIIFLKLRESAGYDHLRLQNIARILLWATEAFQVDIMNRRPVKAIRIEREGVKWFQKQCRCRNRSRNRKKYLNIFQLEVTTWLCSMNLLAKCPKTKLPFDKFVQIYLFAMEHDYGFSPDTIRNKRKIIQAMLGWYFRKKHSIKLIKIADIDEYVAELSKRDYSRKSWSTIISELRSFLKFAKNHKWCRLINPDAIIGPKIYRNESVPIGPSWENVIKLVSSANTDRSDDIRDLPILMLFATYGLRAYEVANLRLEDIDWERSQIQIRHAKNRLTQLFPLVPSVGNAILRYLQFGRPKCECREIFLKLTPPIGPISRISLSHLVHKRMHLLGIECAHRGPHSIRHSFATHLLAEGFSLKEIGDQLGHTSTKSTSTYAKVDLNHLRIVADFNFGGVL